jgi:hypothetical protein
VKKTISTLLALLSLLAVVGCGPTIYVAPDFESYRQVHKTMAILPFQVVIDPNKLPKDYTLEMAADAEKAEGYLLQNQLYVRFLQKQAKNEYTVVFQDVAETVALLSKAGVGYAELSNYSMKELKDILGVDALLSGTVHRSRPMSTTTAVVLGALFGAWGNTNEVVATVSIYDGASAGLLWKYEHKASGSVGSSSEKLAESLMKNISKKFPYKRPTS